MGKSPCSIAILDAFHDSDRGGVGILFGAIDLVQDAYGIDDEHISVVYRYSESDERFRSASRHLERAKRVRIYGSALSTGNTRRGLMRVVMGVNRLLESLIILIGAPRVSAPAVTAIREADLVVSKGGEFYHSYDHRRVRGLLRMYFSLFDLILALRLGKDVIVLGHTFGPFYNRGAEWLVSSVLRRCRKILTRESISADLIIKMGVPSSIVGVCPDTAFYMQPRENESVYCFLETMDYPNTTYAVVTARHWGFPDLDACDRAGAWEQYLQSIAEGINHALEHYVDHLVVGIQNDGQHIQSENDVEVAQEILKRVRYPDKVLITPSDLSPDALAGIYRYSEFIIGTRLHSIIFASLSYVPSIGISYRHKVDGIMSMLGIDDYVLDINCLTPGSIKKLIDRLVSDKAGVEGTLRRRIPELRNNLIGSLTVDRVI